MTSTELSVRFKSKEITDEEISSVVDYTANYKTTDFTITNWTSYSFDSDFFTPTDGFTLELSDDRVESIIELIDLGDPVDLYIDNKIQCTGYIERIDVDYDRSGGTTLKISGRDKFGIVCDSMLLPSLKITEHDTYISAIMKVLAPFGFTENQIVGTDQSEIELRELTLSSGISVGKCIPSRSGRKKSKKLKGQIKHQLKPQKGEGAMQYLQRICARAGWIIKLFPTGDYIWIGPPLYERDEAPIFNLIHKKGKVDEAPSEWSNANNNNVLNSSINIDWTSQPSYIVGEATANGGKHRRGIANVIMPNDLVMYGTTANNNFGTTESLKAELEKAVPEGAVLVRPNVQLIGVKPKLLRNNPLISQLRVNYIYDDESKSIEELEYIIRYKMAEFNDKFFTAEYEVDEHVNNDAVWQINMLCTINDDSYPFLQNANYWIQGRTFTKSRSAGTKTKIKLKLPYVWDFYTDTEADKVFNLNEVEIISGAQDFNISEQIITGD